MDSKSVFSYGILLVRRDSGAWCARILLDILWHLLTSLPLAGSNVLSRFVLQATSNKVLTFFFLSFCLGANAALLLYDITNASTFEDIRGWLEGLHVFICLNQLLTLLFGLRAEEELRARAHHIHCWF